MIFTSEYLSCQELVQELNKMEMALMEANDTGTKKDFLDELVLLPSFSDQIIVKTENLLRDTLSDPLVLHRYLNQLSISLQHSLRTCTLRTQSHENTLLQATASDAYRLQFRLDYIGFLQEYHELLHQYYGYISKEDKLIIEQGQKRITASAGNEEEMKLLPTREIDPDFYDLLLKEPVESKIYRITVFKRANDISGGIRKFVNSLNDTDLYDFFGTLIDTNARNIIGNVNDSDPRRYTWRLHMPRADKYLRKFLKKMGIIRD